MPELKEAIEIVKKSHPYATKYKGVKEDEALQKLVEVAELLEQVEKGGVERDIKSIFGNFIKSRVVPFSADGCNAVKASEAVKAIREAIDLCNAHLVKKLEGVEEILFKTKLPYFPARPEYLSSGECEILSQAIITHLTKKEE